MVKQLVIWYNNPENEIVRVNDLDLDIIWKIRKYLRSVSMAKTIKLPADLRDWKVTSFVGEDNGCEVYKVSRKIDKNTAQNAILRHAFVGKSNYTDEHAEEYFCNRWRKV